MAWALEHMKEAPAQCVAGRWYSINRVEKKYIGIGMDKLVLIFNRFLTGQKQRHHIVPDVVPVADPLAPPAGAPPKKADNINEIAAEEMEVHRLKMSRWKP